MLPVDDGPGLLRHIDALCPGHLKPLPSAGEYRVLPIDYIINSLFVFLKTETDEALTKPKSKHSEEKVVKVVSEHS